MVATSINYAAFSGIHSTAAAIVFAAVYAPLGLWFIRQSIKNTTYVYIVLTLFCIMREAAFVLRAIMANSAGAGSNLSMFIADQVLFGVGFFALLYSAYSLVLDRHVLAGGEPPSATTPSVFRNSHLFRIALMAGVAIGIVATIDTTSSNPHSASTGRTLRKVSTAIFFVLTVIQAAQTIWFFREADAVAGGYSNRRKWGDRNGRYLLVLIAVLLLVREVFLIATINDTAKQSREELWYPLVALPELLAVVCYAVSGLVPTRVAIKKKDAGFN
ncbi:hypothetical protein MIND_00297300 [Mycena indigotica]|uniref:Uncharacterized protein n=1 Tax=Mycena indigotica TaxID=2126181 RepID=A0A8H6T1S0_9AGAR|nr:uncharacterized protein MIND_00297300 [Mycena indigotica]KAF7309270.1 hypothetical protein MIND_00297300 [Mycena indigotica]